MNLAPKDDRLCKCGWVRPLIAVTTIGGKLPPPGLVPAYVCPQCAAFHVAVEMSEEDAARVFGELRADLMRMWRAGAKPNVYDVAPARNDACPQHPPAETLGAIWCAACGAWKPTQDAPLVYIGTDGVHRAIRNSPTPPAPDSDDGFALVGAALEEWKPPHEEPLRGVKRSSEIGAIEMVGQIRERRQTVKWLRSDQGIGGDDMVAKTIADSIEHGEHVLWAHAKEHGTISESVEKASVPDQEISPVAAAENKGAKKPETPPLSDQQCECRERAHGKRCPMPATHRISTSFPGLVPEFYYYCADCTAFRVPHAQRIDGSGVDDFIRRPCPDHDESR